MEHFNIFFHFIVYLAAFIYSTNADSESLYTYLTSGRNKHLRPRSDTSQPTEVFVDFFLSNLEKIDPIKGTVSITGYFQISWEDPRMTWKAMNYNNISYLPVPQEFIWKPPLINGNTANEMKFLGIDGLLVTVMYDGKISWLPGQNLKFSCIIDTSKFPFDKQVCDLIILIWGYSGNDIVLNSTSSTVKTLSYNKNSEWDLENTKVLILNSLIPSVNFRFSFRRRPVFLVITLLLPAILLALLNTAVFILPQESGERISFCITLLLSNVVYLTIVQELLPASGEPSLSSMCIILTVVLILSGLILLSVIISCRMYHDPEIKIPNWLQTFILKCSRKNKVSGEKLADDMNIIMKNRIDDSKAKPEELLVVGPDVARVWDKLNMIGYLIILFAGIIGYFLDMQIP